MDGEVDGREACRGPGGGGPLPLLGPQDSHAGPPQTSHSSGWSLVCSRSGWLCLVSFCQVLEGLHSSVVLLVPVGASLAAL